MVTARRVLLRAEIVAGGRSIVTHTLELDRSQRGDALYRFVFSTMLGLGTYKPRAGFPHVEAGPVCTLGWKDPVAAIKIGPHVFVVKFAGKHVASVEESPA